MTAMHGFTLATPPANLSPTLLAIDTTAGACSVALLHAGRLDQLVEPLGPAHSRRVLAMVSTLLERHLEAPAALDAIAFGAGPGSFTGLRVACGIAQGLGFGWDRPLLPIGSMATLASQAAAATGAEGPGWVLVAIDARMGQVYRSAWRRDGSGLVPVLPASAVSPADAAAEFDRLVGAGRAALAGDGFVGCEPLRAWAAAATDERLVAPASATHPEAAAVVRLAAQAWAEGRAVPAADAAPLYVRDKVALDVGEQAALRARRTAPQVPAPADSRQVPR
jgi:tRNA threonylcarbamoyladenosine biosynthesis protein TsaB